MLKKKTKNGIVSASVVDMPAAVGISLGVEYKSVVSLESNGRNLFLLLNDDMLQTLNVKVLHTDKDWVAKA